MDYKNLLQCYAQDYAKQEHPFLLFNLAGGDENAHTRILLNLLKFGNNQFLPSFLMSVGLPSLKQVINLADQFPAIGLAGKSNGFIDLYLEYKSADDVDHKVIIENKINGAGDTLRQLERYIATVNGITDLNGLNSWSNKGYPISNGNQIHVLYLSDDGQRMPDNKSLTDNLKTKIDLIPISYENDLLPWIKDQVLPSSPYSDQGIMIAGIRQYVASLEARFKKVKVSSVVKQFVDELPVDAVSKYVGIQKVIQDNLSKERNYPADMIRALAVELKTAAEDLFATSLQPGWVLHFTPSFFLLYKQGWAQIDAAKPKSYPSVHIAGDTKLFLKGKISGLRWVIERTRTTVPGVTNFRNTVKKPISFRIKSFDPNEPSERLNALNGIIAHVQGEIKIVDEFIYSLINHPFTDPNDKLVVKLLS